MPKHLYSGNEAVARGAYEAGVKVCSAYPGTPSTEIFESLPQYEPALYCEWAPNEKVALEVAYGASIANVRSMCAMKHVGLNVAADPMFTAAYNGVGAGFVIITADDPDMHSSQNEQDNRRYAEFAKIPMLEPSDSLECQAFIKEAFEISERFDVPVIFRMTTRLCHSKSLIELHEPIEIESKPYSRDASKFVSTPANARRNHASLEKKLADLEAFSNASPLNQEIDNPGATIGVISSSVAFLYAQEAFGDKASYLKLGLTFPLPMDRIRQFASRFERVIVIEELEPFMETAIRAAGIECEGKAMTGKIYELNPQLVEQRVLGIQKPYVACPIKLPARAPSLCPGCPHRGFFYALSQNADYVICGDIGCYTLGCAPPLNAMDSVVCMGGGFTLAHGMAKAFEMLGDKRHKVFGVLGDSTFFHSGLTGASEIIYNSSSVIPCILDNRITGMTGQQDNPGTGRNLMGGSAPMLDIEAILRSMGYDKVLVVDPWKLDEVKAAIKEALDHEGHCALIAKRPCLLIKGAPRTARRFAVDSQVCKACRKCLKLGCGAISMKEGKSSIDPVLCGGCSLCAQTCPFGAIKEA